MKTSDQTQNWRAQARPAQQPETQSSARIGDDDGISNRTMNMILILFMLLTMGVSLAAAAQPDGNAKYRILLRQAMLDMDRMHYDKAIVKLLEVRANTPENANVNYLLGRCYLYGELSNEKATFYLSRAVSEATSEYEEWVLEETRAPLECIYLLATAYEKTDHFDMAVEHYAQFLGHVEDGTMKVSGRTYAIISRNAQGCRIAAAEQNKALTQENLVLNK